MPASNGISSCQYIRKLANQSISDASSLAGLMEKLMPESDGMQTIKLSVHKETCRSFSKRCNIITVIITVPSLRYLATLLGLTNGYLKRLNKKTQVILMVT